MYHWNPNEYTNNSSNQKQWGSELIGKLHLLGTESVLDIGCGDGELTSQIAVGLRRGSVIGIDSSAEMIRLARQNNAAKNLSNLSFIVKDAQDLDFENAFDVVFSNACLHWITNQVPVLNRIHNSLKKGGRAFLQMGGYGNAAEVFAASVEVINKGKWTGFFSGFVFPYGFYHTQEYKEMLLAAKFQVNRVELIPKDMVHETRGKFTSWIRTTWLPYTQRLPEPLREDFINEVVDKYLESHHTDDGFIHISMSRLEVEAGR